MTTIDTSLSLPNQATEVRKTGDNLGKDDFLKLLITQLQNQDPSSPMDNSQFIAQMATFSTLEQIITNNSQNSLVSGSDLIGKQITWKDSSDQEVSATVKSVLMSNGKLQYEVNDDKGTKLSADQLIKIAGS
jgi:flagellar basal-body rod modification protein FlgD